MMLYALAALLAFPALFAGWIAGELARGTNRGEFNFEAAVPATLITYVVLGAIVLVWIVASAWKRDKEREARMASK